MSETLLRQWELLRAIPRAPRKVDVTTLMAKLATAGYRVTKRTLQRDLNQLSVLFPLLSDTRDAAFGWSWDAGAPAFDLPTMDAPTALSVRMIEQFIPMLLPPPLTELLAPQFTRARAVLDGHAESGLRQWAKVVRVVPREMPLQAPEFDSDVVRVVYDALLGGKRFAASYRSRAEGNTEIREYEVNPLGLVARGNLLYLVCTLWHYQDIRQLALHRIQQAAPSDTPVTRPADFDLDGYIAEGAFELPVGPLVQLKLKFERSAAEHLHETPLSGDQIIEDLTEEHVIVTATLPDSKQLEWWLLGLSPSVEVLEPTGLRNRIIERISTSSRLYSHAVAAG